MSWIQTYSGIKFDPLNPSPDDISIIDIAHALSNICRFTGHTRDFYSVGQHSIIVSYFCSPQNKLWGLLHDASEAYIADIARPLKRSNDMKIYREIEDYVMAAVCKKFNLAYKMPEEVREMDNRCLYTEKRDLLNHDIDWGWKVEPFTTKIVPMENKIIKEAFLYEFSRLTSNSPIIGVN